MPIFEEFLILTYKEKNLDIIEYFSLWGNEVPDYLKNLSIVPNQIIIVDLPHTRLRSPEGGRVTEKD